MKINLNKICFTFFLVLGLVFCYSENVNASVLTQPIVTDNWQIGPGVYNNRDVLTLFRTGNSTTTLTSLTMQFGAKNQQYGSTYIYNRGVSIPNSPDVAGGTTYTVPLGGDIEIPPNTDVNFSVDWYPYNGYSTATVKGVYASGIFTPAFTANLSMPLPPCESYTYSDWTYCNEAGHQTRTILSSTPTDCNYTDVNSAAPVLGQDCTYVAPVYPEISLPFTIVSPFTFSYESTAKVDYTYDTNVFTPYDYIEIRRMSSDWSTSTFIATSSPTAHDLSSNGHSFFTLTGDPEIRGRYNYEVTGYFAPYYLPGVGDVPATSSIPVIFSVYWQKTQIPTAQDIIDYQHTISTELAHGVLYESSCTDSEWATPDPQVDFGFGVWTFPALNFTRLQCSVKLAVLELGTKVIDKMTGYFTKVGNMLKNVFPFNIYTNLNEAWENSAYTDVLPELSFLSPVNGNLSVQVPNGVTGSSTPFVLWGSSIFTSADTLGENNANKASLLFGAIRTIIKWALWGLFGFWVVRNGQAFVKKLTGGE